MDPATLPWPEPTPTLVQELVSHFVINIVLNGSNQEVLVPIVGYEMNVQDTNWLIGLNYLLPQITSLGFDKQSYQAIVDGVVLSIKRAHESLAPGLLAIGETEVTDANINRSLFAYLANPASERANYQYDVDKTITMLRFQRLSDGLNLGVLAWHSVHGTSMLQNNTHVSG